MPGDLKTANHRNLEVLVYRMELTYDKIMNLSDIKLFPSEKTG